MTQLLLNLRPTPPASLENFVAGRNAELLSRLRGYADRGCFDAMYLWGGAGCGKSHLLAATVEAAVKRRPARLLSASEIGFEIVPTPGALLAVDDVQMLSEEAQLSLFRTFNASRLAGLALLIAGAVPPGQLPLREDLRTRIGQMLVFEVKPISDEEKSAALRRHALLRGMHVDDKVLAYLLSHGRRDLISLMSVLDTLDRVSLEQKKPVTIGMLKEVLRLQSPPKKPTR